MNPNIDTTKPDIKVLNLAQLFGGEDGTYKVPNYQREYSWSEDHIEALFKDLHTFHQELVLGGNTNYLLGQAIFSTNHSDKESYKYSIVDGQQRLTSLYLFTLALYRWVSYFADGGDKEILSGLHQVLYYRNLKTGSEMPRIGVAFGGDKFVEMLLQDEVLPLVTTNKTQENIKDNFEHLNELIRDEFGDNKASLISFVDSFLHKVWIVQVALESDSLALEIFDKINSRGLPLSNAELLKVLIFRNAQNSQFDKITDAWNDAGGFVYKVRPIKASSMQFLMKSLIGQRLGSGVSHDKTAKAWELNLAETNEDMLAFAKQIKDDASFLSKLGSASSPFNEDLHTAKYFKTVQHLPIALAARKFSSSPAYSTFAKFLDARLFLSILARERSQTFEAKIWPWAKNLSELGADPTVQETLAAGFDSLDQVELLMANAKASIAALDYNKTRDQKLMRFILAVCNKLAERDADAHSVDFDIQNFIVKTNYHLDHVYPKSLVDSADFDASNGKDWVHKIGNITLLHSGDNQRAGAANAGEKSIDYSSATLILTKSLAKTSDLLENDRVTAVINELHGIGFQQVSQSWGYDQVMEQIEAYWNLISRYIREGLQLKD